MSHAEDMEISPWDYRLAEDIETVRNCWLSEYYQTRLYQNYLLSLSKTYPVISAAGQTKGIGADEKQLQTYKKLQYYQLFEKNKEKDE